MTNRSTSPHSSSWTCWNWSRRSPPKRQRLMEHLYGIQRSISRRMPLQEVLQTVVGCVKELLGDDMVGLWLPDPHEPRYLLLVSSAGLDDSRRWRVPAEEAGAAGRAVLTDELTVEGAGTEPTMAAPVRENQKVVGSLFTASRSADR